LLEKSKIKKLSDLDLVQLFSEKGLNVYLGEIYERYTSFVFFVCMKYMKDEEKAKDALMQIFEKLLHELHRHEIKNFKAWLHTVSKNHCLYLLRQKEIFVGENEKLFMESAENLYPDNNEEDKEENFRTLEQAIQKLKKEQKTCIELFYLKEMTYKEVSEKIKMDIKKVKSHIQNGKRNLKILLMKHNEQYLG
jgi:RNA polymerase sigma-70 factor, ECF subfamily